jgi:hypothetical protein
MDGLIRNHVKGVLHLPSSTPNGLFYCAKRDGGLGIPKLEMLTVSSALKQGLTLLNIFDSSLQALFRSSQLEHRLRRLATSQRLPWPDLTFQHLNEYKRRVKKELRQWSRLPSKGKAVLSFSNDKHGNSRLYKP